MEELIPKLTVFFLLVARLTAFFVTVPFFSYRTIPSQVKIIVPIILAWTMYYTISPDITIAFDGTYILYVLKEVIVGLSIGLVAYLILSAVQIAGGLIDFQMGFAIANIIDPQTGAQSPIMGQFFNVLTLLVLLATNGHHLLLDGIYYSYQYIAIDQLSLHTGDENFAVFLMKMMTTLFAIAFQMSAPVVAALFLVTLALGIVGKTVPQMNIFVVGFPIKIVAGFIFLIIVMGVMINVMGRLIEVTIYGMRDFMTILGGM